MKVLLTGAFGNVGLSTINELLLKGHDIRIFDIKSAKNQKLSKEFEDQIEIIWGDIRNYEEVESAVDGIDVVLHVAAIIPPLADQQPQFAEEVNVGGTENMIKACEKSSIKPKIIYTSSISVYGDRRDSPLIKTEDPTSPTGHDEYGKQKLRAEKLVRASSLHWTVYRLTYIVSLNKLQMDPLMFSMPLETCIEICDTKDVGLALANGVENDLIIGKILNIAGGKRCRIIYRDYLHKMLDLFGLGGNLLPESAFSTDDFHCGFLDTTESQELLHFQRYTLEDYFNDVKKKVEVSRFFLRFFTLIVRPIAKRYLLARSPYYKVKS